MTKRAFEMYLGQLREVEGEELEYPGVTYDYTWIRTSGLKAELHGVFRYENDDTLEPDRTCIGVLLWEESEPRWRQKTGMQVWAYGHGAIEEFEDKVGRSFLPTLSDL